MSKRSPLKRRHSSDLDTELMDESGEFDPNNLSNPKRFRNDPDVSDLVHEDWSDDFENLFAEKFVPKSPTTKLMAKFQHTSLNESKLLKQPRLSSAGRRTIGLTANERRAKFANSRLQHPSPSQGAVSRASPSARESPRASQSARASQRASPIARPDFLTPQQRRQQYAANRRLEYGTPVPSPQTTANERRTKFARTSKKKF